MRLGKFSLPLAGCVVFALVIAPEARTETYPLGFLGNLWLQGNPKDSDPELERLNSAFVRLAEKVRRSVVHVRAASTRTRGSGFIINSQGYILTASHVVDRTKEVEIRLANRQRLRGEVIASDPVVDFAIVKIDGDGGFPVLALSNSDLLKVGELVGSLGYPFGAESSLHLGIVSRRGKRQNSSAAFDYIQLDSGANSGESGGPVVNMKGHVVGMMTLASERGTIGFAVPINVIKEIIPRVLNGEKIVWGWLGVKLSELTLELADDLGLSPLRGVLVSSVLAGEPGERAGMRPRDVILSVNEISVDRPTDAMRVIKGTEAGNEVKLTIFREGEIIVLPVKLGVRPKLTDGAEG